VRSVNKIVALEQLWEQRTGETDAEYWGFIDWVEKGVSRGAPPAAMQATAQAWEWAQRASAFDRAQQLAPDQATSTAKILDNLVRVAEIESTKLVQQCSTEPHAVASLKDIVGAVHLLREIQLKTVGADGAGGREDLSKFTVEELRMYQALKAKAKGTNK
jgi:hypothetical protein